MKNTIRKMLMIITVVVMAVVCFAFSASALEETGQCGDDIYWTFDENTGELVISSEGSWSAEDAFIDFDISKGEFVISGEGDMYNYETDDSPFDSITTIKKLVIEEGVTTIGNNAFRDCINLESVTIPDSVIYIGHCAFNGCDSLENITIPVNVRCISYMVFTSCDSLESITVDENNQAYSSDEYGVLFTKSKTTLIQYPMDNERETYIIPDSVTSIGDEAFVSCYNLTSVTIPDSVITIGTYAFWYCRFLTNITIGNSVTTIKQGAFKNCENLGNAHYCGTQEEWNKISIGSSNSCLTSIIHMATDENGDEVCDLCGYPMSHNHTYIGVVTAPTCTAQGYTTYTCECGDSYVDNYTEKIDHEYTSEITTPATHLAEGVETFTCSCGYSYIKPVARLEGHTYEEVVTAPTCTARGYTTYTCECGDSYKGDYIGKAKHSYNSAITTEPTHTKKGVLTYTCSVCGDSYNEDIAKLPDHTYTVKGVTAPTCTTQGYTTFVCACGDSYNSDHIPATGHSDNNSDSLCDSCGKKTSSASDNNSKCSHICHKDGILGFIWKVIRFFYKLFGAKKTCICGVAHY